MNFRAAMPFLLFLLFFAGFNCSKDNDSESNVVRSQLKLGMQEVYFSQPSEALSWTFPDIDAAKLLFDYMDDLKISRFRYTIFWTSVERSLGNFEWDRHDALINYLTGKGIKLTVTLFGDNYLYYPDGSSPYPGHPDPGANGFWNAWLLFVEEAVARYGDRVDRWEIWNEPDLAQSGSGVFWKPLVNAADFSSMLIGTSRKIKAIQPGAKVVMGGVTNFNGYRSFLQSCFDQGILEDIDEIGVHLYRTSPEGPFDYNRDTTVDIDSATPGIQSPATIGDEITSLRTFVDSYRQGFPVRNTEEGFISSSRQDIAQMKYFTRMILVEHSLGIEEVTCFRLRVPRRSDFVAGATGDAAFTSQSLFPGIIDQTGDTTFTPRPAYYALKNIARYLIGSNVYYERSLTLQSGGYTVRVEIYSKNGLPVIAYWIEEPIDNTLKVVRNLSFTISDIGSHAYRVINIRDNTELSAGTYTVSGNGISFSNLPATDYPFILMAD
ncbi:MAG TPA: hypothetical protein PLI62_03880 [Spirochaetota bacterium]|nr:hypothetical protein [Spirochaetota bacterium]